MKETPDTNQSQGYLILFCGLPGTLKTYISVRLSGRLGYGYLPTRSVGSIAQSSPINIFQETRQERYQALAKVAHAALQLGANIIVDGGFMTIEARDPILNDIDPQKAMIIHCLCSNNEIRKKRLEIRAVDPIDYERQSAKEILTSGVGGIPLPKDDLTLEVQRGRIKSVLSIDTANMTLEWKGEPSQELLTKIPQIINELLVEYQDRQVPCSYDSKVQSQFDELAEVYDQTTEWRQDEELLASLQRPLEQNPARILDIGTGTGLASAWYAEQGHHVVGIDISPMMLRKAAERLTLTLLGEATQLPFLDDYFDLIIIRQSLHYVDARRLLDEAGRTLMRNGLLVISAIICPNEKSKTLWQEFKSATQPLRLRVFTENDLGEIAQNAGFNIFERSHHSLIRREKLASIESRAGTPLGGWHLFLKNFEKIAAKISPELMFSFDGDVVEYKQYWITMWARRVGKPSFEPPSHSDV